MKTIKFFGVLLLAGATVVSSCKKDEEDKIPNIAVTGGMAEAAPGETVTYTLTLGSEENKLSKLEVSQSINGSTAGQIWDTTFSNATNTSIDYAYTVSATQNNGDKIELTFKVTDSKSLVNSKTQTITVKGTPAPQMTSCGAKTMGSYKNTTNGSFYDAEGCMVYKQNDASSNQSKVDFVYYYGSTNQATLAAPTDATFGTGSGQIDLGIQAWTTKNATKFKKLSGFDFANADGTSIEVAYKAASNEDSKANKLANGDVVGFMTVDGKYGVAKVDAIQTSDNGTVSIDVKVQK